MAGENVEPETPVPLNEPVPPAGVAVTVSVTSLPSTHWLATASMLTEGIAFTTTVAVPASLVQLPTFTTNEYSPAASAVALAISGFLSVEVKLFGPDHVYVPSDSVPNVSASPTQIGEFEVITGFVGGSRVFTSKSARGLSQPLTVCDT